MVLLAIGRSARAHCAATRTIRRASALYRERAQRETPRFDGVDVCLYIVMLSEAVLCRSTGPLGSSPLPPLLLRAWLPTLHQPPSTLPRPLRRRRK